MAKDKSAPLWLLGYRTRRCWVALAFFILYFLAGEFSVSLVTAEPAITTPFWPPSGIGVALLVLLGRRYWPLILLASVSIDLLIGTPLLPSLLIGIGDAAEGVIAATLLKKTDPSLERVNDVLTLLRAVTIASVVNTLIGPIVVFRSGMIPPQDLPVKMFAFWVGDTLGGLVVGGLLLTWLSRPLERLKWRLTSEAVLLGIGIWVLSYIAFVAHPTSGYSIYTVTFMFFPFVVWTAFRFGQKGVSLISAAISVIVAVTAAVGRGSFAVTGVTTRVTLLQLFIAVLSMTGMLLAASLSEQRSATEALNRAVRQRDEFLSIASHELKTPLTPLNVQLQILLREIEKGTLERMPKEARDRLVHVAYQQIQNLNRLIDALLDVSRVTAGRMRLNFEKTDIVQIINDVLSRYRDLFGEANCEVRFEADPSIVGSWDRLRIEQVITNIMINAAKFGRGRPISISVHRIGDRAEIRVRDEGIGVKPEDRSRVFERFERAVSSRQYGGFGLGLYIARQIVLGHGGDIHLESEPGHGATFIVDLPLRPGMRRTGEAAA